MTTDDELLALARAATRTRHGDGLWMVDPDDMNRVIAPDDPGGFDGFDVCVTARSDGADAAFIAAASPERIEWLILDKQAAEAKYRAMVPGLKDAMKALAVERDEWKAKAESTDIRLRALIGSPPAEDGTEYE